MQKSAVLSDPSTVYYHALLEQPLCSPINLTLAVGQGSMAIFWSDVGELHLHQHVHLQEGDGTGGVTAGLLQGYYTILVADVGQLGLDECDLLCKLELRGRGGGGGRGGEEG